MVSESVTFLCITIPHKIARPLFAEGAGVCETKSKKGRARDRKLFIYRVYSAQSGIGTVVSDHGLGRGQKGKGCCSVPYSSQPFIFLQKEAVSSPCDFATAHLTPCILQFDLLALSMQQLSDP